MADENMVMSESDISSLKETLCAQQQLLQKLYNELDAEREASATAASEALSVILRLQGEKAAIKMEAEQYKRLSEEKISHAEESLAIIEDIIYSKQMEVAALDHQVQAYRCKLLSMGCADEVRSPENPMQKGDSLAGETSIQSFGRRNSVPLSHKYRKASCERDADMDLVPKMVERQTEHDMSDQVLGLEKKVSNFSSVDINSYWEQIRRLGERVKEIAGANSLSETRSLSSVSSQLSVGNSCDLSNNIGNRTRSPSPQISFGGPNDSNILVTVNETEETTSSSNYAKNTVACDYPSSPSIHDVFEVPRVLNFSSTESVPKCGNKTASHEDSGSPKREVIHPEAVEVHYAKEKPNLLRKKALRSPKRKKILCRENTIPVVNSCFVVSRPTTSVTESLPRSNQLSRTSEIIEVERPAECNRAEELKLLNEIKQEINSLREEVQSWKVKKSLPTREEPSLDSLQEAMLYFWL